MWMPGQMDDRGALWIDTRALEHNLSALRSRTQAEVMAVVKNNGYGLGLIPYAGWLTVKGVRQLAVGCAKEAVELRRAGIGAGILLLTPELDEEAMAELTRLHIQLQVSSAAQAVSLLRAAKRVGRKPLVHIALDTGLGRWGFTAGELEAAAPLLRQLRAVGCYTHFGAPYAAGPRTVLQARRFTQMVERLHGLGVETGKLHCCASGAFLTHPELHMDGVRLGSALVGGVPDAARYGLRPVVQLRARIALLKTLGRGEEIGYGQGCRLRRDTRVAVVPTGYSEGVGLSHAPAPVGLSGRARAALRRSAPLTAHLGAAEIPVLGRVGANHLMLDLTGVEAQVGDVVSLPVNPILCPATLERVFTASVPSTVCVHVPVAALNEPVPPAPSASPAAATRCAP